MERPVRADMVGPNLAMLANTVETVEATASNLQHVLVMQGTKYYGSHLGPFKTPAKEDDPRHPPPNFYPHMAASGRKRTSARAHCLKRSVQFASPGARPRKSDDRAISQ